LQLIFALFQISSMDKGEFGALELINEAETQLIKGSNQADSPCSPENLKTKPKIQKMELPIQVGATQE
jgi:hypothetical protein